LAAQYKGEDKVVVCFFGDGASNQGTTHEAMNLAACWKLPLIFIAENNHFGEFTHQSKHQTITDIAARAGAYDIPGVVIDGNDVTAVNETTQVAIARARAGQGPTLIECKSYRVRGHFEGDPQAYRDKDEAREWSKKDPIDVHQARLLQMGLVEQRQIDEMDAAISAEIDEAVRFAEASPLPEPGELLQDVYS